MRGTTTAAILRAIDANGLVETSGQRAVGLTSVEWKLTADLVAPHTPSPGGALAEEYNRLVVDADGLIDALNWARW